ncbi:tetratricopeptide repeat protein [Myxococcota bacterium]|nr:tetratricopeptide repeat protein [Myxococcota bacterium]
MLAPTSPRPLVALGEISLARGKVTHADEAFQQALALDADHVPALTGQARAARARGDDPRAEALLRQATVAAGQDWRTWQNLGVFLMERERLPEAEETLRTAILRSDGQQAAAHLALAELLLRDGRPAAALLTSERALELQESGHAWYLRGRAHYDMGEAQRAEEDFRRAVLLAPDLYEARAGIGLVLAERGELEQAAEAWRAVIRLAPDNRTARETLRRIEEDIAAAEARGAPP